MFVQSTCRTVREKMLAGYNLIWNSHTHVVHATGQRCHAGDHLDEITPPHEHFFRGHYQVRLGATKQLIVNLWDPQTNPFRSDLRYHDCLICRPDLRY